MYKLISSIILVVLIGCVGSVESELTDDVVLDSNVKETEIVSATPLSASVHVNKASEITEESDNLELVSFNIDCYGKGGAKDGPRKVVVGYENCDDKSGLTASNIATLAKIFIDVWEEREYPNLDKVREHLSRFMVISIHSDGQTKSPEMARLKFPDLDSDEALEKLGDGDAFCFPNGNARYVDVSDGSKFFIVLGSHILVEGWIDIVVHEIAHAALYAAYGNADGGHKRSEIWLGHSENTVMDEVLGRLVY